MRFLNLQPRPGGPAIPLHPRITVILGLSASERVELVASVHCVAAGEKPLWQGSVAIDGNETPLSDAVNMIGSTSKAALITTAVEISDGAESDTVSDQPGTEPEHLQKVRESAADVEERLGIVEKLHLEKLEHVAADLAQIDGASVGQLDQLDGVLQRATEAAGRPNPWTGMPGIEDRVESLFSIIEVAENLLGNLPVGDRIEVAFAISNAQLPLGDGSSPDPRAVRMLEAWSVLEERREMTLSRLKSLGLDMEVAAKRVDFAAERLEDTTVAVTPRKISAEESAAVELAQDHYLSSHDKATSGIRRKSARHQMQEARDEVTAALEPIGYETWSLFRLGNGMIEITDKSREAHEEAKEESKAAEIDYQRLAMWLENDPELSAIDREKAEIFEVAVRTLGFDPVVETQADRFADLPGLLSEVQATEDASAPTEEEATATLRTVLEESGSDDHLELRTTRGVVGIGESWLAVLRDADRARQRLSREVRRATDELKVLRTLNDDSPGDQFDPERSAAREVEAKVSAGNLTRFDLVTERIELQALSLARWALAEEREAVSRIVRHIEQSTNQSGDIGRTELSVPGLADRIPRGLGGPIPMVVLIGDADASQLNPLLALPPDIQVLVVGDGDQIIEWTRSVGPDHASVVDRGVLV